MQQHDERNHDKICHIKYKTYCFTNNRVNVFYTVLSVAMVTQIIFFVCIISSVYFRVGHWGVLPFSTPHPQNFSLMGAKVHIRNEILQLGQSKIPLSKSDSSLIFVFFRNEDPPLHMNS